MSDSNLTLQKCVPCESDIPPLTDDEIQTLHKDTPEWEIVKVDKVPHLRREFKFDDFADALAFTITIGAIAEEEGHHPLIELTWGRVTVDWWTHNIGGLHKNDFIMAAKTSEVYKD